MLSNEPVDWIIVINRLSKTWVNNVWMLAITFVPMIMAGALMNTVANGTLTKKVPETATGEFFFSEHVGLLLIHFFLCCQRSTGTSLGLSMATHSLIRTISPTLGAYLYSSFGYPSIGLLGFVLNRAMAAVIMAYHPPGFD